VSRRRFNKQHIKSSRARHAGICLQSPQLGKLRQVDGEFQTSNLSYITTPCLKTNKQTTNKKERKGKKGDPSNFR
jgi:hypothetical protein